MAYAKTIKLKFYYWEDGIKNITTQITDLNDQKTLISMCHGSAILNSPSCGFGAVELVFIDGQEKVSIFPACDSYSLMRYNNSGKYFDIGSSNREKLVKILTKYGVQLPLDYSKLRPSEFSQYNSP